jgi:solute carrier family 35 protein C2
MLTSSQYNEWMFDGEHLNFKFPLFTTCAHMLVQFSLASLVLFLFPRFRPKPGEEDGLGSRKPIMSSFFYLTRIGPCGAATGLDIGLGNTSLRFISLTFFSSSPIPTTTTHGF